MKWWTFVILAVLAILLQTALVKSTAVFGVCPDLMFILVIHYALWGPWPDAPLAGWLLGLLVDLETHGRVGLHAFLFGAVAWAIYYLRQSLYRDHPLTQIILTFLFTLLVRSIVPAYDAYRAGDPSLWSHIGSQTLLAASYTALLAPCVHWPLIRMHRWTGLRPTKRTALNA